MVKNDEYKTQFLKYLQLQQVI